MRCICLCTVIGLSLHSLTANSEPAPQELPPVTGVVDSRATLCLSNMTPQQPVIALTTQRFIRRMSPDAKKEQPPLILGPSNTFPAQPAAAMPSPAPTASFQALPDNNAVIPPDTQGAVGPNHLMTTLNSQVRIQDRSGTNLKTVSLTSFWTPVGGISFAFDPHIRFDPYGGRWIFTAAANQAAMDSALLIGVSATSDPTGDWYLFKIRADATGATWVDYPALGFNKDWIVISANMFTLVGSYAGVNVYVLGKEDLYGNGTGDYRLFQDKSGLGFTILPCVTYDATLSTQYLIEDYYSGAGVLRVSTITGPLGAEVLTLGTAYASGAPWAFWGGHEFLPQLDSPRFMDEGDARIVNCVYRNGCIWAAHTALLPTILPTRAAAQWWQILPSGSVRQVGRIDDPSGVASYAYPSIAVNANDDALIGYSKFSSTQYVSANYAFRYSTDPLNSFRSEAVLKAGEGPYFKTYFSGLCRWGDYTSTVVDPVNDLSLWTIQEYADVPVGPSTTDGSGRWGTWWGRIDPFGPLVQPMLLTPVVASGVLSFSFQTSYNRTYTVEYKTNLNNIGWTISQALTGDGTVWSVTNTAPDSTRYYRVRAQ